MCHASNSNEYSKFSSTSVTDHSKPFWAHNLQRFSLDNLDKDSKVYKLLAIHIYLAKSSLWS